MAGAAATLALAHVSALFGSSKCVLKRESPTGCRAGNVAHFRFVGIPISVPLKADAAIDFFFFADGAIHDQMDLCFAVNKALTCDMDASNRSLARPLL